MSSPSDAPLDIAFLLEQVGGSAAVAKMVVEEFGNQTPLDREKVSQLLAAKDLAAAGKVAHSLKGSSAVLGAKQLSALAAELEMLCRANNEADANEKFQALNAEIARCMDYIPTLNEQL